MARHENLHVNKLTVNEVIDKSSAAKLMGSSYQESWSFFEDFNYKAATVPTTLVFLEGSDTGATYAVAAGASGVLRLTSAAGAAGTFAVNGVTAVLPQVLHPAEGDITVEARIKLNTDITNASVCVGLHDVITFTEPAKVTTATITTGISDDGTVLVYDDAATSNTWHSAVVSGGVVDTDYDTTTEAGTGVAPVADTYQILKVTVNAAGTLVKHYIDNVLVKTIVPNTALAANMYAIVTCNARTAEANVLDVDYIKVTQARV